MKLNAFPKAIDLPWPNQKKSLILKMLIVPMIIAQLPARAAHPTNINANEIGVPQLQVSVKAQQVSIQGRVVDECGLPLPGASVKVKGSGESSITDQNGKFTITAPNANATLVVSYIGYEVTEVIATSSKAMVITLKSANAELNELVVVGYGVQKKVPNLNITLQEIRRERRVELAGDGFRFNDLLRWKAGKHLENPATITGMKLTAAYKALYLASQVANLPLDANGYMRVYANINNRTWNDKMYLYPLPLDQLTSNKSLIQNPGW